TAVFFGHKNPKRGGAGSKTFEAGGSKKEWGGNSRRGREGGRTGGPNGGGRRPRWGRGRGGGGRGRGGAPSRPPPGGADAGGGARGPGCRWSQGGWPAGRSPQPSWTSGRTGCDPLLRRQRPGQAVRRRTRGRGGASPPRRRHPRHQPPVRGGDRLGPPTAVARGRPLRGRARPRPRRPRRPPHGDERRRARPRGLRPGHSPPPAPPPAGGRRRAARLLVLPAEEGRADGRIPRLRPAAERGGGARGAHPRGVSGGGGVASLNRWRAMMRCWISVAPS